MAVIEIYEMLQTVIQRNKDIMTSLQNIKRRNT
jgi:hypothetical protein